MKIHPVQPGSDAWRALRSRIRRTASVAPIMMSVSKKMRRSDLVRMVATGDEQEFSRFVQEVLFEKGHAAETAARPFIEAEVIGNDLYPITATDDAEYILVSADGITEDYRHGWECKLWNEEKAGQVRNDIVPEEDRWQVVQALVITCAEDWTYTVTDGTTEKTVSTVYRLQDSDEKALMAGWRQFDDDVAAYVHVEHVPTPEGRAPETLPALRIEVTGMVTASNLAEFKETALAVFKGINRDLKTDEDFANAAKTVKWCEGVEDRLGAAKQNALGQTKSIDELFRTIDAISEEARATRLELNRLVESRKTAVRAEILQKAQADLAAYQASVNDSLARVRLLAYQADFAGAMKGKKSVVTLQDAADTTLATAKIAISAAADEVRRNLKTLDEWAGEHIFLFSDLQTIVTKPADDFTALVKMRIADHKEAEAKRLEAEQARIRAEEERKENECIEQERRRIREEERQKAQQEVVRINPGFVERPETVTHGIAVPHHTVSAAFDTPDTGATMKLGTICALLGFTVTADFLATIGFSAVGTERAAKLYRRADFGRICQAIASHVAAVAEMEAQKGAA